MPTYQMQLNEVSMLLNGIQSNDIIIRVVFSQDRHTCYDDNSNTAMTAHRGLRKGALFDTNNIILSL